jgi:DNA-directed RNA polymerase I subunit RPA1
MDSTAADNAESQGIRQVLEKKEGLFRKHMMGKRVNFAARWGKALSRCLQPMQGCTVVHTKYISVACFRSVISPDPYIGAGEIGVPPYFAKRLSFPERVTPWNVERLREAVIRGHDELPGAVAVEDERGRVILLATQPKHKREAIAKQLLSGTQAGGVGGLLSRSTSSKGASGTSAAISPGLGKIVYRHLGDGDLMLTNRQPTLHKPGLMAHRARVLKGERTIRMHYANCATFNADFDGDEINLHLPQVGTHRPGPVDGSGSVLMQ